MYSRSQARGKIMYHSKQSNISQKVALIANSGIGTIMQAVEQ